MIDKHTFVAFDIESTARPDALDFIEIQPPGNFKDPVKIAAHMEEAKAKKLEKAACSAETGKILAIGWCMDGENYITHESLTDEASLLQEFWNMVRSFQGHSFSLVGFYSHSFDLAMLIRRSWICGVPTVNLMRGKYFDDSKSIDLIETWKLGNREDNISLGRLSKLLGVGEKVGSGADYAKLLESDPAKAKEYHINDLFLTWHCGVKMGVIQP